MSTGESPVAYRKGTTSYPPDSNLPSNLWLEIPPKHTCIIHTV